MKYKAPGEPYIETFYGFVTMTQIRDRRRKEDIEMNVKDMVKDKKRVKFTHYTHKELWYETECGFAFPVPIEDCGEATFLAEDKAMLFMRYIRKHIELITPKED